MTEIDATTTDINRLIDHPYSELTDEQIELVLEFKAENKARDATYQAMIEANEAHMQEVIAIHKEAAESAQATFDALVSGAIANYQALKEGGEIEQEEQEEHEA